MTLEELHEKLSFLYNENVETHISFMQQHLQHRCACLTLKISF